MKLTLVLLGLMAAVAVTYGQDLPDPSEDGVAGPAAPVAEDQDAGDLEGQETFFFNTYARPRYYGGRSFYRPSYYRRPRYFYRPRYYGNHW